MLSQSQGFEKDRASTLAENAVELIKDGHFEVWKSDDRQITSADKYRSKQAIASEKRPLWDPIMPMYAPHLSNYTTPKKYLRL